MQKHLLMTKLIATLAVSSLVVSTVQAAPPTSNWANRLWDDFNSFDTNNWARGYPYYNSNGSVAYSNYRWQGYIPTDGSTSYASNGNLELKNTWNPRERYVYVDTGYVSSAGKKAWKHGYFEIRAKLPTTNGGDSGAWLYATRATWPPEIDIVEVPGANDGKQFLNNVHFRWNGDYWTNVINDQGDRRQHYKYVPVPGGARLGDAYHTFAIQWDPNRIIWYFNGKETHRVNNGIPRDTMYLNMAYEVNESAPSFYGSPLKYNPGSNVKPPNDANNGAYPLYAQFDYARVWQKSHAWSPFNVSVGSDNRARIMWVNNNDGQLSFWRMGTGVFQENSRTHSTSDGRTPQDSAVKTNGQSVALWTGYKGEASLWTLNYDGSYSYENNFGPFIDWTATDIELDSSNRRRLMWRNDDGRASIWVFSDDTNFTAKEHKRGDGFEPFKLAVRQSDGQMLLVFRHMDGRVSFWRLNASGDLISKTDQGPFSDWRLEDISGWSTNVWKILWRLPNGTAGIRSMNDSFSVSHSKDYGPYTGWQPLDIAVGPDGNTRLIWEGDGKLGSWMLNGSNDKTSDTTYNG